MTDLALLRRWTDQRDAAAFKEIVSRYAPMVYATCRRILRNRTEAEDITQECLETLVRTSRVPTEHLGAWLHRVATNRSLDRVRSERRRKTREANFVAGQPLQVEPTWNDVYAQVDEAITELPEKLRVAVVAHYLGGESHGAIARATGVPRRTVSRRVSRAIELIGESLKTRGIRVASGALGALMAANLAEASAVPASVTAGLGKLALAQSANVGRAATTAKAVTGLTGGVIIMKKLVACTVVVVAVLLGLWAVTGREPSGGTRETLEATVTAQREAAPAESTASASSPGPVEEAPVPAQAAEETSMPRVSGSVVDADTGEGVAGATVAVVDGRTRDRETWEGVTDEDGHFEVAGLRAGNLLVFKKTGPGDYMVSSPEDMVEVCLRDGQRKEGLRLKARKGGTVSGKVTDHKGAPIAGAKLTVYPARNESFQGTKRVVSRVNHTTESDAAGEYVFRGLKLARSCVVIAGADGFMHDRSDEFSFGDNDMSRRIDFKLSRGSAISGWVQDRDGIRLPNDSIWLEPVRNQVSYADSVLLSFAREKAVGAKSDDKGEFRIEGLLAGTYHLLGGGLRTTMGRFDGGGTRVEVDGVHDVEGVLVTASSLEQGEHFLAGHVVDAEGAGIADAEVCIAPKDIGGIYRSLTDEKGAFLIDGLASDVFLLSATAAGYTQELLDSVPVDEQDLTITLERNAPIRGHVWDSDNGKPVSGARVSIAQHDRQARVFERYGYLNDIIEGIRQYVAGRGNERAVTDQDGGFELPSVDPGRVKLKAERSGYAASYTDEFVVEPDQAVENVTIYLDRGATIEGLVRATNGASVGGVSILVIEAVLEGETDYDAQRRLMQATSAGQGGPDIRAVSNIDGSFVVEGLADGTYWLRAIATGYAYGSVLEVSIRNESSQRGVELSLDPGGTIEGYVTQGWAPKADILAQVHVDGKDAAARQVYSDAEGYYAISHLAPGEWDLRFVDRSRPGNTGVREFRVKVVSGETARQDAEYSGHAVTGLVFGLEEPQAWQVAVLVLPDGEDPEAPPDPAIDWPSLATRTVPIRPDGNYIVSDVPDGVYKLTVFRLQDNRIVAKNVWQTIDIAGEDFGIDLMATEDLPMDMPVPE